MRIGFTKVTRVATAFSSFSMESWVESRAAFLAAPSQLSDAQYAAEADAEEQAKFDKISFDAPLEHWFPYIEPHIAEHRRLKALENIVKKPDFVPELSSLMLTDGPYDEAALMAAGAMHVVAGLESTSAELVPSIVAAGSDIIERIERFNQTTPEQDPSYHNAADIDIRFMAWLHAADKLYKLGHHDFKMQLQEIIDLAKIREDSIALQSDVVRVGSFYLDKWNKPETLKQAP
jgi:hypothetical protein